MISGHILVSIVVNIVICVAPYLAKAIALASGSKFSFPGGFRQSTDELSGYCLAITDIVACLAKRPVLFLSLIHI